MNVSVPLRGLVVFNEETDRLLVALGLSFRPLTGISCF